MRPVQRPDPNTKKPKLIAPRAACDTHLHVYVGNPVVISSMACIWYAMKMIDIKENVSGFGRLMPSLGNCDSKILLRLAQWLCS